MYAMKLQVKIYLSFAQTSSFKSFLEGLSLLQLSLTSEHISTQLEKRMTDTFIAASKMTMEIKIILIWRALLELKP